MAHKNFNKQKDAIISILEEEKPRVRLSEKILPEIVDWEVGQNYKIGIEVTQLSLRKEPDKEGFRAEFEINSARDMTNEDPEELKEA